MGRRGSNDSKTKIRPGVLGLLESEVAGVHLFTVWLYFKNAFLSSENKPNKSQIRIISQNIGMKKKVAQMLKPSGQSQPKFL